MNYSKNTFLQFIFALLLTLVCFGCRNYKSAQIDLKTDLPPVFYNKTDSASMASLPLREFFTDTNLLKLIDTAIVANPDILSALQRVELANADLRYNRMALLPSVTANANVGVEKYGDYTQNGVGNYDTNLSPNINGNHKIPNPVPDYFLGFRSSWEVDLWGRLRSRRDAAFNRFLASQSGYRVVVTSLTAQIATAYYQLLALDNELRVIRKNIVLQDNALEIVKIQKLGGRATELAVQQFLAQLKRTKSLEYQVLQQITETENELNFLTGRFTREIDRDTSINTLKLPLFLQAGLPSQLLLNRPDIREAEYELKALNADIKAARAAYFPALNLTPYLALNSFNAALLFNPGSLAYGILGGLTAPIFNRRLVKRDYAQTIAQSKQALYNYRRVILNSFQEARNSIAGIENYRNYYEQKQQEVDALNNAVSVANDLYVVGRASYLEVITAQRNVLDAELELANTKKNIFINTINLYRAVGGGWKQ